MSFVVSTLAFSASSSPPFVDAVSLALNFTVCWYSDVQCLNKLNFLFGQTF